jgi:signal peptidase I
MNYFRRRKLKKQIKHILHDARHARHMREDVAPGDRIDAVLVAEQALKDAWNRRDYTGLEQEAETLMRATETIYPPKSHPRTREYLEILVVAVTVAMAFRTFFVQPFKIPTGSMEPTLYGIKVESQVGKGVMDYFPLNLVNLALFGDRYVEVRSVRSGVVDQLIREDPYLYSPNGVVPPFRLDMVRHFELGDYVTKGQVVASGRVRSGDHIFVNKVRYNFVRPKRGDVFVFSTDDVEHEQVQADTFYIKRLVGLPGEAISIDPPYLLADGVRILEPDVFRRQVYDRDKGYHGYVFPPWNQRAEPDSPPPLLANSRSVLRLADDEYLPFGDNAMHSLDGRYFGGIRQKHIVGPAVTVYWPLSSRWGRIR